jgi:hypothetical protein
MKMKITQFFMNIARKKLNKIKYLTIVVFALISQLSIGQNASKIFMYNEFTGAASFIGPTKTTGASSTFTNLGPISKVINNGRFLGVQNGEMSWVDSTDGHIEFFNIFNGVGSASASWITKMLPTNGTTSATTDEPHAGEVSIGNPNFVDFADDQFVFTDADGSLSAYSSFSAPNSAALTYDPTWTAYTGGGPVNGLAPTNANILAIEDNYIFINNGASDNNVYAYVFTTGAYVGISNLYYPTFSYGGPLNGIGFGAAVNNTVPGITFLGCAGPYWGFYDAAAGGVYWYTYNSLVCYNPLTPVTTLSGTTNYQFSSATPMATAMASGNFIGVCDNEFIFKDADGNLEWYNYNNGIGVYEKANQYCRGPQAGILPNPSAANYIDASEFGLVYLDSNNTTSWYYNYGASSGYEYTDQTWFKFTGGGVNNNQPPSKANILSAEDGLFYVLESNGSLHAYDQETGVLYPSDLWTYTTLTNGPLAGKSLANAVKNLIPGVQYLGIANDELVFAAEIAPTLTTDTSSCANNGKITVTNVIADKYAVSVGSTYVGADYASATALLILPTIVQNNIPNTGGTYTIRFFNGDDTTYKDTTIIVAASVCGPTLAAGTIVCNKTSFIAAPMVGVASDITIQVTMNITTVGPISPIVVSGSGFTMVDSNFKITANATGVQTFNIPAHYDGTALGTVTYSVGNLGTCNTNLTTAPYNKAKKIIMDVLTPDNCTFPQVGPALK